MISASMLNIGVPSGLTGRCSPHTGQHNRSPLQLPSQRQRPGALCTATRKTGGGGAGGAGRKPNPTQGAAPPPQQPPREGAAEEAREDAADSASDAIKDAGDQLADAVGSGVQNAEGALADTQSQAARGAAQTERQANDVQARSATPAARSSAADASVNAADARRQAASAAAETRSNQQIDAARAEDAVREQAAKTAGAAQEAIESVPTPAEGVQGAADGAADAIRGLGQAAGAASSAADDLQKNAEGFASDLQRSAQQGVQQVQEGLDSAAEEARRIAKNAEAGSTQYARGQSLLSNTAQLTSMAATSPNGLTGEAAVPYHKARLLSHVAGLDRGFAANARQTDLVESAVQTLVAAAGPVDLLASPAAPGASGGVASPVSMTNAGVTSIAPEISSISPEAAAGAPGPAPNRIPPAAGALPPPGAGLAEGAAPPGSSGSVGGSGSTGGSASSPKRGGMQQLAGVWRLVYSSGFASKRSTGGRRPGVPISLLPAQFGQVYQGITPELTGLDNIVELRRDALPSLPFLPANQPAEALLTLKHRLLVTGPRTVQITFTGTDVNLQGGVAGLLNNLPQFNLPELPEQLQPSTRNRAATFDVLFLDEDLRVTRGDRGEVRVFVRT